MTMTRVLRSRVNLTVHARFCNGGGAGDRPADRSLGGAMTTTAGWMLVFSQFKQVLVLPVSFSGYGGVGIRGAAGPMDGL